MQAHSPHNKLSTVLFFGLAIILLIVGLTMTLVSGTAPSLLKFGNCTLRTEIAQTKEAQAKGLGGRAEIPADYTMLFPFKDEQPSFWMKGMLVPIDIIWVSGHRVVQVNAELPPDDGIIRYSPPVKIDWVIEVRSGLARQCDVTVGSTINGLRS